MKIKQNDHYRSFFRIKEYFEDFKTQIKDHIEGFGLNYNTRNQSFILIDREKLNEYLEIYKDTKDTKDTDKEPKKENDKGTNSTKVTINNKNNNNTMAQTAQKSQKNTKNTKSVLFVPCAVTLLKNIKKIILDLETKYNNKIPEQEIVEKAKIQYNIPEKEIEEIITKLKRSGDLGITGSGFVSREFILEDNIEE